MRAANLIGLAFLLAVGFFTAGTLTEGEPVVLTPVNLLLQADYLEVPILLRSYADDDGLLEHLHLLLGPALGFNLGASLEDRILPQNSRDDVSDAVRDIDLGLVIGVAVTIGSHVVAEARGNVGLLSIPDDGATLRGVPPTSKWRSVGVMLGVTF